MRVLMGEDDLRMAALLEQLLAEAGCEPTCTTTVGRRCGTRAAEILGLCDPLPGKRVKDPKDEMG